MGRRVLRVMRQTVQSCYTLRATQYGGPQRGRSDGNGVADRREPLVGAGDARLPLSLVRWNRTLSYWPLRPSALRWPQRFWHLRGRRSWHKTTRAGLRQRAREESEALMALIREREAAKPADPDAAGLDPDEALRCATEHDEELRLTYRSGHLPRIADLCEQLAERGIREEALEGTYESVSSEAEARTVSTALLVMADRLR